MLNDWIKGTGIIVGLYLCFSCTYAGGKKESIQTDTIMKTDTMDKNSLEYITSILPLYQRIYDPETGLEMYDEELGKEASKWSKYVKTADGWIIDIWTSGGRGGTYSETPPLPGFYEVQKCFYPNGKLKSIVKMYERSMSVGTGLFYDEAGNITEKVDYDSFYKKAKIPFEEALEIFDKTGFIDLKTGKGRLEFCIYDGRVTTSRPRVHFSYRIREGIPYWIAQDGFSGWGNAYEINALTGETKKVRYDIPFEE